jgi:enamine deaminase RidA (YjgF/YER057c/UK114 family)
MPFTVIHPPNARPVADYHMAVRVASGRLVHTGTIGPFLSDGRVAGPKDPAAQARRIFQVMVERLRREGTDLSNIVRMTTYLVRIDDLAEFARGRAAFFTGTLPPATLIGVPQFANPDVLAQVEAVVLTD